MLATSELDITGQGVHPFVPTATKALVETHWTVKESACALSSLSFLLFFIIIFDVHFAISGSCFGEGFDSQLSCQDCRARYYGQECKVDVVRVTI
jgi:hypothetical protein